MIKRKAPDFNLPDQSGKIVHLRDYAGKWLVLYFYPKDYTPTCTKQACSFRDSYEIIQSLGNADVIGISKDSVRTHANFTKKHGLTFSLLCDSDHATAKAYGSWRQKKFMGRTFYGLCRDTYIINPDGYIEKSYHDVKVKNHIADVINTLQLLQQKL